MKKFKFFLFAVLVSIFFTNVSSAPKYNYVSISGLAEQEVAKKILPEIYKSLGIEINIESVPGERAKNLSTSGQKDGETLRIFSFGEKNPMLLRVPTAYSSLETMPFFIKGKNIVINSKKDLEKYNVVIVRGVQHTKDMTEGLTKVHVIDDSEQMMKFLESGRADVALTNTINGLKTLKKLNLTGVEHSPKPLDVLNLYHYIHEKNKDLVPKVDEAIKKMKNSGELKKLRDKHEKNFLNN